MARRRNIVADDEQPGAGTKLVLLSRDVKDVQLNGALDALKACARDEGAVALPYVLRREYADFSAEEVLRRLLPAGMEVPSAFESIGHIIHLNLRDEQLPYKHVIATVLLDKHAPRLRSVVNKVDSISNEFRVFPMELLAGDADMRAEVKQNGCTFQLKCARVRFKARWPWLPNRRIPSTSPPHAPPHPASRARARPALSRLAPAGTTRCTGTRASRRSTSGSWACSPTATCSST